MSEPIQPRRLRPGVKAILKDYDNRVNMLDEFGPKIVSLIKDILGAEKIGFHSVRYRVKKRSSLERKLNRPDKKYTGLDDVSDVLGARVITYFPDEVDVAAALLRRELNVTSITDRRETDDPRQFGYASLHYDATIDAGRAEQLEYRKFAECPFEIQIRSILQHAWAEIEHDLGYKTREAIPRDLRRRFSRLAGMLELADDEFRAIRDASRDHARRVATSIADDPAATQIDQDSLSSYFRTSTLLADLDEKIAELHNDTLQDAEPEYAGRIAEFLAIIGITSIGELDDILNSRRDQLTKFSASLMYEPQDDALPRGVSAFHLTYLLKAEEGVDELAEYLRAIRVEDADEWARDVFALVPAS